MSRFIDEANRLQGMSLHVLAYNLKRVMKIMGTGPLIEALRA